MLHPTSYIAYCCIIYTQIEATRARSNPTTPPEILFTDDSGAVVEVVMDVLPELVVWAAPVVSV